MPDCHIAFLVKKDCEAVLKNHPVINEVIAWDKKSKKYSNLCRVIRHVRTQRFDVVVNLHRFASSGLITALSRGTLTAGFSKNPLSFLFGKTVKHQQKGIHELDRNLLVLKACWADATRANPIIATELPPIGVIDIIENGEFVTIFPGSLWKTKQFPNEGWINLLKALPSNCTVLLLGSKADDSIANEILLSRPEKSHNLCGQFSVLQSAWLMSKAKMNYTNDSAPTHMASAVNAPVTAVFCSTIPEFGFTPVGEKAFVVQTEEKLNCRPCGVHGHRECPEKHFDCGHKIRTEQLLEGVKDYVAGI